MIDNLKKIYENWGLNILDDAIASGLIPDWQTTTVAEPATSPVRESTPPPEMEELQETSATSRVNSLYSSFKRKRTSMDLY